MPTSPASPGPSSQYRDDPAHDFELQDYYDSVPPPHRLSGIHDLSPYPSSQRLSSSSAQRQALSDSPARGVYTPPLAADSAADLTLMSGQRNNYTNMEADNEWKPDNRWQEKAAAKGRRSKWIAIGSVIALIGLIAVGVAVGVTLAKKNSSKSSSSTGGSTVKQTDPNDPSTFVKDSRLHQSFYGLAYTPAGSQLPDCGNNLTDVITDIQIMSQLTTRLRLYGADCNQTALVLEAIKQTKTNMSVYLGNYPIATDSNAAYDRQRDELKSALQTYGTDNVIGITVGNEFMLNYLNANSATDPNGAVGNQGAALLNADITDMRSTLSGLSLSKTLTVGTSDAGSYFNNEVLAAVDYGMSNVHPWFANVSIDDAAAWTADFFAQNNVAPAAQLSNNPKMFIAETGWPTHSLDAGNESNGPSTATEENLQKFLDTFVCQANANGTGYFYFETFDEPWKDVQFGGVEGSWGMFYSNKTLKGITIPDCVSS